MQRRILFACQVRPSSSTGGATPSRPVKIHRKNVSPKSSSSNAKVGGGLFCPDFSISEKMIRRFPEQIKQLTRTLEDRALEQADQSSSLQKEVDKVFVALRSRLENDTRRLAIIGSASNSLLRKGSDIDIVFMPFIDPQHNLEFQKKFALYRESYLNSMSKLVATVKMVRGKSIEVLHGAKVPIIQFRTINNFKVDIQICCPESIVSSYFIGCSVRYDIRVRALILWLLNNFSISSLKDSRNGLFSSYHICSLVIHFLRSLPDPILPDFHSLLPNRDPFISWTSVLNPMNIHCNRDDAMDDSLSSGHLLVKMIDYYSQIYLHEVGLNVTGGYVKRKQDSHGYESDLYMWDPCFASNIEGQCRVSGAPILISQHFTGLRMAMEVGNFSQVI